MIRAAYISEKGGRDYNEDSVAIIRSDDKIAVVLADGLGSCGGGKTASEAMIKTAEENADKLFSFEVGGLMSVFSEANNNVVSMQTKETEMKTTAVILIADSKRYIWGYVGDSRLYHFKNGQLVFQTADHSVPQMKVSMGEITLDSIRGDPDRNRLLRAVGGDKSEIKASIGNVRRMYFWQKNVFLLCSDGFWENVFECEMEKDLKKSRSPEEWLERMHKRLAGRIPENGDNYSAAAIII